MTGEDAGLSDHSVYLLPEVGGVTLGWRWAGLVPLLPSAGVAMLNFPISILFSGYVYSFV